MPSTIIGAPAASRTLPEQFGSEDVEFSLFKLMKDDKLAFASLVANGCFQLLHRGRAQSETITSRFQSHHTSARSRNGNNLFGGRLVRHKLSGTVIGAYCVGNNYLQTADPKVHASAADFLVLSDAGAESGLGQLMLDDLDTRAAAWGASAGEPRVLSVLVSKEAFGPILKARGFKLTTPEATAPGFGVVAIYTKSFGQPKK